MENSLQHRLRERVKELTALHQMARLLQDTDQPLDGVMGQVVNLLPVSWQFPECTEGRITFGESSWATPGFQPTDWQQSENFTLRDGRHGCVEVVYTSAKPELDEGPFLKEERDLLRSLADMLRAFLQHRQDDAVILAANERLEQEVADRTAALRQLASELCLAEERERRQIAEHLHDHLGQGLAVLKIRLQRLRGDAALGGHNQALEELITLSNQVIRYTRELTFEVSPPVLYELGLGAALDWLGEETSRKHGLKVKVKDKGRAPIPDQLKVMLWKSARELLHNIVKHAEAKKVDVRYEVSQDQVTLEIKDNGCGFDAMQVRKPTDGGFGLFSIEERLRQLGGHMTVTTGAKKGTNVKLTAPIYEDKS